MTTYLARYYQGEYKQVWEELVALGEAVYAEPLLADAKAVARETMRRARRNIEVLISRLVSIGYQFGYSWLQPPSRSPLTSAARLNYMDAMCWARAQYPVFVPATAREELASTLGASYERLHDLGAEALMESLGRLRDSVAKRPTMQERIAFVERLTGRLPLSIAAWYEVVGSVNFVGHHPNWISLLPEDPDGVCPMYRLDPLVIAPLEASVHAHFLPEHEPAPILADDDLLVPTWSGFDKFDPAPVHCRRQLWEAHRADARYYLELALWPREKYNAGPDDIGVEVRLPQLTADPHLVAADPSAEMTFVQYLRLCFRWGGFPGWQHESMRAASGLAELTADLLPL